MVIGIGNEFRRDDGAGPAVVASLRHRVPPGVRLVINLGSWPNRTIEHEEAAALVLEWGPQLRQPERYPAGLLETLWAHFCRLGSVLEAYLAEVIDAGHASLVVALRMADGGAAAVPVEAERLAATVHGVDLRVHELGEDDLSHRLLEAGVCFFDRAYVAAGFPQQLFGA